MIEQAQDLQKRELVIIGISAILIMVAGFYPAIVLDITDVTVKAWVRHLNLPAQ